MTLPPDTLCTRCQRRIWLHKLARNKAWCQPKAASPNLLAPEVMAAKETLGHPVSYNLWAEAMQVNNERKEAANEAS